MTRTAARNEAILLGILALLAVMIALVPWKDFVLRYNEYQAIKYDFANVVRDSDTHPHSPSNWRVDTEYRPKSGTLRLHLSHRYNAPAGDFLLLAEFSAHRSALPVSTLLRNRSGGVYRSDNVWLSSGEWLMSLTGIQRSEFVFRREQILRVN